MQDFSIFVAQNLWLCLLFGVLLAAVVVTELRRSAKGGQQMSPQAAVMMMNRESPQLIDIRDAVRFNQGHIAGARQIDAKAQQIDWAQVLPEKGQKLLLICERGQSVLKVADQLQKLGYTNANILAGGMTAWRDANLPITKGA